MASSAPKKPFFHSKALVETRRVGSGTNVWAFAHLMKDVTVGRDCNIGDHTFVENGVRLGNRVTVKNGVSVWRGVAVEDDVFIGPNVAFTNDRFPVSRNRDFKLESTRVKRGSAIGANATVICGVTIGAHSLIGAGSVVTRDVPDHAMVYGNPARLHGYLCSCRKPLAFRAGKAACACGRKYRKSAGGVTPA